jgi:PBP1b-binding outer membrane lipoprotein LpoB
MLGLRRETTAIALCLIAGSCVGPAKQSGRAPENPTVEPSHEAKATAASRAAAMARRDSETGLRQPTVETVDPAVARIGVVTTRTYHTTDCSLLKGVPTADQIRFTSKWDALDTGYAPCELCRPQK